LPLSARLGNQRIGPDGADAARRDVWQTPWPQLTVPGLMILARCIVAVGLAVGAAKLLARWIERKWPGQVLPAESRIEG
jgi:hypothetical protein